MLKEDPRSYNWNLLLGTKEEKEPQPRSNQHARRVHTEVLEARGYHKKIRWCFYRGLVVPCVETCLQRSMQYCCRMRASRYHKTHLVFEVQASRYHKTHLIFINYAFTYFMGLCFVYHRQHILHIG